MPRQVSTGATIQAPVGGWDTLNALADMPEQNAVILDNWFPGTDKVQVREGFASHVTGIGNPVETLLRYTASDGGEELFGVANDSVYDVTTAGAVGSAVVGSLSNARFQYTQITTAGGHFLIAMNGEDAPPTYDGSSWGTASITGPTAANLIWCNLHQRRLWFGERNSLKAHYLPVNSIAGAASSFDIGALVKLGGYIMAMGTWTRDSGAGADDVAVFVTSEGEAVVYSGTDPSSASTWSLVGVFRIGKPIGRRCIIKFGGDLIIATESGLVPASQVFLTDPSQTELVALSQQINKAFNDAVMSYGTLFGWEPFVYPSGLQLIFNIPTSATTSQQFVFNTITRAPCRYTGIPALCWELLEEAPYFGSADGTVYKFGGVIGDNGSDVAADALQAFSYFKTPQSDKFFKRVEPIFQGPQDPNPAFDLNVDFQIATPSSVPVGSASGSALWGVNKWGVGVWGSAAQIWRGWRGVRGHGSAASVRIRINTKASRPSWLATRWLYTPGGNL